MSDDSSDRDLQALWQGQAQEKDPMTLEHIQAISRRLDRNEQRAIFILAGCVAFMFFVAGQQWQRTSDLVVRGVFALYTLGFMAVAILIFRELNVRRDPTEPGGVFLRRRLERRLSLLRGRILLISLPLAPGLIGTLTLGILRTPPASAGPSSLVLRFLPLAVLLGAWVVVMAIRIPRQIRRFRRELEELNAAMR